METVWKGRLTQTAARYSEVAPQAGVCCNACRSCVQSNLIGVALAGVLAVGTAVPRALRSLRPAR
jgi:hypothetical protein